MGFSMLLSGLMNALSLANLWYCFLGCFLGTFVGVLPGLGPATTLSILFPLSLHLPPDGAIIMMAGLYYGAMYGGSTTSILVNIPGEVASVVTCLDGFQMTRQGRAGQAIAISAIGSFIAGILGTILVGFFGFVLASYALRFGPPEYFGILCFSLTMLISLSGKSLIKGLASGIFGIFLATVGLDALTGSARLNFGSIELMRGIGIIPLCVGVFGIGEIISSTEQEIVRIYEGKLGRLIPRGAELRRGIKASLQGTATGFVLGIIPGMIPALTAFLAYDIEKRYSRYPERFGTGLIEGVAAPEAANNATAMAGFIPMVALGIPTHAAMAIMLATLMMHGLQVGPLLFKETPLFIWTVIASMLIGNGMLLILNLPLVGMWARISLIPFRFLAPIILAVCFIGVYAVRNTMFDVWVMIVFGVVGFFMKKKDWPLAPLILGFILGDLLEVALRQSLSISGGSPIIFFERPISLTFIIITIVAMIVLRYYKAAAITEEM